MTYEELLKSDKEFVVAADIAPIIRCDPYALHMAAIQCPERLGFPSIVLGRRVKFPRRAFIKWVEGNET